MKRFFCYCMKLTIVPINWWFTISCLTSWLLLIFIHIVLLIFRLSSYFLPTLCIFSAKCCCSIIFILLLFNYLSPFILISSLISCNSYFIYKFCSIPFFYSGLIYHNFSNYCNFFTFLLKIKIINILYFFFAFSEADLSHNVEFYN